MFTIFISNDSLEVIKVLPPEGDHINATYHNILKRKARRRQIIWHHDDASSHTAASVRDFLADQEVIIALHPS